MGILMIVYILFPIFITFTDDITWYTVTYILHTKVEALNAYKGFEA